MTIRLAASLALLLGFGWLTLGGCRLSTESQDSDSGRPAWFQDVTAALGLDFVHDAGPTGSYFMPQIMGSGCALFDYDNDGRLDLVLLQNAGPDSSSRHRLYHQEKDGRFSDVSSGSGLDFASFGMGVAIGDVNNDGWPDVLITSYGGCKLFLNNQGSGTFTDVTQECGLDNRSWGMSAAFFDYDRDGWLDLVIVNYLDYDPTRTCLLATGEKDYCHPSTFPGTVTRLFHNLGRSAKVNQGSVRFEDVTLASGLGRVQGRPGLGVICADFDGDGWPDILIANDSQPNRLWINQKNGTFTEEAVTRGLAVNHLGLAQANMGLALADVAGSGMFDIFVTHLTEETHALWRQGPRGQFQDRTVASGLTQAAWRGTGFGTVLADFNHDGFPDLALVNGRIAKRHGLDEPSLAPYWRDYAERNQLFNNDGNGRFQDLSAHNPDLCGWPNVARGLAWGDIDNDGAIDLVLTTVAGPARLLLNIAPKEGRHWLMVRALDPTLKRDAYGAEITVTAAGRKYWGSVMPASSYLCSNDGRVHFGLNRSAGFEALDVAWPDGSKESFPGASADRLIEICKGKGVQTPRSPE
jgi:hypothetical protein